MEHWWLWFLKGSESSGSGLHDGLVVVENLPVGLIYSARLDFEVAASVTSSLARRRENRDSMLGPADVADYRRLTGC